MSEASEGAAVREAAAPAVPERSGDRAFLRGPEGARAVLFDLDGTLLDTENLIVVSFRHTVQTVLGRSIPDELLMAKVGQPLNTQMWDFADSEAVHDELCRVYRAYNAQVHDELIRIFPGTAKALEDLRQLGLRLGVVTSKRRDPALRGLATFGLDRAFDVVVGSDDWPTHKPDPGPVTHACDLLDLPCASCVYVGDSPFDLQAGHAAGCSTVAALWGMFPQPVLESEAPDFVCKSIEDVAALMKAISFDNG